MTVPSCLYQLLIGPLELFFDVLYSLSFRLLGNQGLSIIALSLCMNFLVLPLYRRADAMQAEERELELRLQPWVKHIKKTFTGNERFLMLQAFYRQNGYRPADALKGSLSLLLEIPFFIAAYRFLSHLNLLQGVAFGPIRDLGAPDGLLRVGGVAVNLLPILMTAINMVSGYIYTRGMSAKNKIQLYGMALIFLVLLYPSPAGLVFYWTLNNLFSLLKNIFYKLKRPAFVFCCMCSGAGAALLALLLLRPLASFSHQAAAIALLLLLQAPLPVYLLRKRRGAGKKAGALPESDRRVFRLGGLLLTLLVGVLIPSAVIKSSPAEFVSIYAFRSPLWYVLSSLLLAAGAFLIWLGVFYALAGEGGKRVMELGVWLACGCALINYLCFATDLGTLSPTLQFTEYETGLSFPLRETLINLLALLAAAALLALLWKKRRVLARYALLTVCVALFCMSAVNLIQIQGKVAELRQSLEEQSGEREEEPSVPLSRTGKNVVVIMLDRAIGGYLPYLVYEKPELKEQLDGFVYYPNTISYGGYTNFCTPALFGGYAYTPVELNRRDTELLADKHNEALKLMPTLFGENGYRVTVCDPPYAGYQWVPDLSIYDDCPGVRAYITKGRYLGDPAENAAQVTRQLERNFFCYGLVKCAPLFAQPILYVEGMYCESNAILHKSYQTRQDLSTAYGRDVGFMEAYSALEALPSITTAYSEEEGSFVLFCNDTTHEPMMLQEPDYVPVDMVDNRAYDAAHPLRKTDDGRAISFISNRQAMHYQCNMASLLMLGQWLDGLRESGVYDNTRIIIVSDHGRLLDQQLDYLCFFNGQLDAMYYNPLLLVKDFDSRGELCTDGRFMTNADVPTLAMAGLIEDPVNPFTGKPVSDEAKQAPEQFIIVSDDWDVETNCGKVFLPAHWISVHDDIFDEDNWRLNADARAK